MNQKKIGVILSYGLLMVNILTGILYTPVMLRLLGQYEYGIYQLVFSVVSYLNLLNLGLTGAYIKFYTRERESGSQKGVAKVNGMFFLIFSVLAAAAMVLGLLLLKNIRMLGDGYTAQDYELARFLMVFLVCNVALSFPNGLFMAYMSAVEDFFFQRILALIVNIAVPLINLPILYFGCGSRGLVVVMTGAALLRLLLNAGHCIGKLNMKFIFSGFRQGLLKELLGFTFFIFLSDIVDQLNQNVDKLLLGRMIGAVSVAIYSVGYSIRMYYTQISWAIPEVFIAQVNQMAELCDLDGLNALFVRIGRLSNLVLLPIITGFIIFGKEFIFLWAGEEYKDSYLVTVLLLLAGYVPSIQSIGVNIQMAMNKHQIRSWIYFFVAVCNVFISVALIRRYGVIGTCMGTLIATAAGHGGFMNVYYHKYIKLDMVRFWKEILRMSLPACIAVGAGIVIRFGIPEISWQGLLAKLLLFSAAYMLAMWLFGLNREEKEYMARAIHRRKGI